MASTTILYRPVGRRELELIVAVNFAAFPPRLPHQPIFCPVLHEEYAIQIARDWNTRDEASGFAGFAAAPASAAGRRSCARRAMRHSRHCFLSGETSPERSVMKKNRTVEKLKLPGVGTTIEPRRVYPQGTLASQLIGSVGTDNYGLSGIEQSLERRLHGSDGKRRIVIEK